MTGQTSFPRDRPSSYSLTISPPLQIDLGQSYTAHFMTFYFRRGEGHYRNVFLEVRVGDTDERTSTRQNPVAANLEYLAGVNEVQDVSRNGWVGARVDRT